MAISLKGTVRTQDNVPVEHAAVQLTAPAAPLGGLSAAAVHRPGAVSWTRTINGFSGHRWNCWQQFVMNVVAGITWAEFEAQVVAYNPVLASDGYVFRADKTYRLPEQASGSPIVLWSRPLAGFQGTRWQCWVDNVRGKVEGITWDEFVDDVVAFNPSLREDGYVFQDGKTYVLPQNAPEPDEVAWTRSLSGLSGNRWQCWEVHVRDHVQGITWAEFMTAVVDHNPVLREDNYVFKASKTYLLPENPNAPSYYLYAVTDAQGQYSFTDLTTPGTYRLIVEAEGCFPYHNSLSLQADTELDVTLVVQGARMTSQWEGYATASDATRRLIDQALSMLGDDSIAFDALPPDLRRLATGSYFPDPNHLYHKDIVCADLVTICLHAAGLNHDWPVTEPPGTPFVSTHAANYFRPRTDHPKLRTVAEDEAWLPGDILIYWDGNMAATSMSHVNLYVGPYSGTDLNGTVHPPSQGYDVVNASIDFLQGSIERGTAILPVTKTYCTNVRFHYDHYMRMRHVDLESGFALGAMATFGIGEAAPAESTTALQGKGVWAYRRPELDRAIEIAPRMGATHVIYKVAKGATYREGMAEAAQAIRAAGLVPLAYAYPLLDDPQGEAEVVVRAFQDGFEGLIFDLEADRCRNRFDQATSLGQFLRVAGIDTARLYNCSYPNISHHRDLPYDQFNEFCRGGLMPMSYGTFFAPASTVPPEIQAARVIDEWAYGHYEFWVERWGYRPPLYPVLAPYHDEQGMVRMGPDEFEVWLDRLAGHGPSFFSVFTAAVIDEELLPLIGACPVARAPEPEPLLVRVESPDSGFLRIRRTPSTELPPLTQVEHQALLTPLEPEENVRAKVGKVETWLRVLTPDGVDGYAYAWYLRLYKKEVVPSTKLMVLQGVVSLSVRPDPSIAHPPLTQVDDDDIFEALEPSEEVLAKVGQPEQWLLIRTAEGIEGYVAAWHVRLYEEPVTKIYSHLTVRSSDGLNVRPGPGTQLDPTWHIGNRTTLQALEEPAAVANKVGQDRWIHVRTPSLHEGHVNGLYVMPVDRVDDRQPVSPGSVPRGECPWIFGLHAAGPGTQASDYRPLFKDRHKTGWVMFTEGIGADPTHIQAHDFRPWSDEGFGVMVRLNNGYDKAGTLPVHTEYDRFADTCARYVQLAEGCHIWVIGNEQNNIVEHPGGAEHPIEHITPERYAQAFNLARARIKAVRPEALVVPGAVDPYHGTPWPLTGQAYRPLDYFRDMMALIDDLDGISLHTYTHWLDPSLITSLKTFDDPPLTPHTPHEHYYHFQAYRAFAEAIPAKWHDRPIYITETNHWVQSTAYVPGAKNGWLNQDQGWVRAAYAEIDRWNRSPYAQQIHCLLLYRWTGDAWRFENLGEVKKDLQAALECDYRWRR